MINWMFYDVLSWQNPPSWLPIVIVAKPDSTYRTLQLGKAWKGQGFPIVLALLNPSEQLQIIT
jgi:hypothetical protein